jgi:hypothetical protein
MFVTGLHRLNVEDTRKVLGADSLAFLPLERLRGMLGDAAPTFCDACFSGAYAVPPRDLTRFKEETLKPVQIVDEGFEGKIEATAEETSAAEEEAAAAIA